MSKIKELRNLGQSIWYDNIDRHLLDSGALKRLITQDGLGGITSNPAIYEKAINGSSDYDYAISQLVCKQNESNSKSVFFHLAIDDIQRATDEMFDVYCNSNKVDGYVSLEVSPDLAYDTEATINEARSLFKRVNRPNVMIKVPATKEGLPAIETLIGEGINVNVTLLFSVERYEAVIESYLRGLERLKNNGGDLTSVSSVASFFVSRVDAAIEKELNNSSADETITSPLQGKIAIANAKLAYAAYKKHYATERFKTLKESGALVQRLLWASTGTKNADYSDVLYVDTLIGADTVNTVPPATYESFKDHGTVALTLEDDLDSALNQLQALKDLGIDIDAVSETLEQQGVQIFIDAFDTLLKAIEGKMQPQNDEAHGVSEQGC